MSTKIPFLVWPLTVERKGKKRQSIKFLKNKKSFLEETKIIFHDFWNAFIWQNKKKIEKASFKFEYSDSY